MDKDSKSWNIISWTFGLLFLVIGILNLFLIHPVPGIFYLAVSLFYLPPISKAIEKRLGFSIPVWLKIAFALLLLWATLAVGDLMEYLEDYI
ncbi:MAG: hypothetical protein KJO04_11945 [Bacteroidia bacterium]|nr:hypothetical protein [Bacteroidia bacterium]